MHYDNRFLKKKCPTVPQNPKNVENKGKKMGHFLEMGRFSIKMGHLENEKVSHF